MRSIGGTQAEQQTLKFRLITTTINEAVFNAANIEGYSVSAQQEAGAAVFEDGRVAFKEFVIGVDSRGDTGDFVGYSTYTFANGDSMTFRFTGGWGAEGMGGDHELVSGAGAYQGAVGTGRFDAVDDPWDNAGLFDGSFTITTQ